MNFIKENDSPLVKSSEKQRQPEISPLSRLFDAVGQLTTFYNYNMRITHA